MRRTAVFMMITLSGVAVGQGLLDCIEPDVLRTLLPRGQGERPPVITGAVPVELSALKMPGQFTWIGSAERITGRVDANTNAYSVTAAWRSSLAPEAARAAATNALASSGWEVQQRSTPGRNVFISASMPTFPQQACRDGKPVSVAAGAMDGVTYLRLIIQRGNPGSNTACNGLFTARTSSTGLEPYLPSLEMPVDPATGVAARLGSSGAGYSGSVVTARVEFTTKDSAGNLGRHFAKQMAEQGWSSDASWSGASTAGSSWSKRVDGGPIIQGTLQVTAFDDRQFMAVLRMNTLQ